MVVDAASRFLSQRELSHMALIEARNVATGVTLTAPGVESAGTYSINPQNAQQHRRPDAFPGSDRPAEILRRSARSIPHHLHPEMKFLNCDYLDRGASQRRHVRAIGIRFIGKEANQWEEHFFPRRPCTDDKVYGRLDRCPKPPVAVVFLAQSRKQSRDEFHHRVLPL
jgi:hypothetical protein